METGVLGVLGCDCLLVKYGEIFWIRKLKIIPMNIKLSNPLPNVFRNVKLKFIIIIVFLAEIF